VSSRTPLVLHGTHPVSDDLFRKTIACGVRKINLNRAFRDEYTRFIADNAATLELTVLQEEGVKVYTRSIERMMEVMGSTGRY
jgi:fructose-bisphosphate aldolase class II